MKYLLSLLFFVVVSVAGLGTAQAASTPKLKLAVFPLNCVVSQVEDGVNINFDLYPESCGIPPNNHVLDPLNPGSINAQAGPLASIRQNITDTSEGEPSLSDSPAIPTTEHQPTKLDIASLVSAQSFGALKLPILAFAALGFIYITFKFLRLIVFIFGSS